LKYNEHNTKFSSEQNNNAAKHTDK